MILKQKCEKCKCKLTRIKGKQNYVYYNKKYHCKKCFGAEEELQKWE